MAAHNSGTKFFCVVLQFHLVNTTEFIHQQMHFLLNLKKALKFTLKFTLSLLLHVSVYDHHQGAYVGA
jgi:hypothetical protein